MKTLHPALLLALAACSPSVASFASDELTTLLYPNASAVYVRNQAVTPNSPSLQGSGARFSVSPELPAGLQIDGATGSITGTPVTVTAAANYTVTARNATSAATAVVNIRIADAPPQLLYASASYTFAVGEATSTGAPANTGAQPIGCAQAELAALGLSVAGNTCEVSGSPTAVAASTTYVLTMSYFDGVSLQSAEGSVTLAANPALSLSPPTITLPAILGETQTFTASGGRPPYSYSVSGLGSIDAGSGVFTSNNDAGAALVTVSDIGGTITTASLRSQRAWVNGPVTALSGSSINWVFVGGNFDRAGYVAVPSLIAANASTALVDYAFDVQQGFDGPVTALVAGTDSVYVGGNFRTYRGLPARGVAKIFLANGALDTNFTHANGAFGTVNALALSADVLYVAGNFTAFRGNGDTGAVAVDATSGKLLTTFISSATGNGSYNAVAVGNNAVYFGGASDTLAAFSLDGTYAAGFAAGLPTGVGMQTNAITVANGTIYAGGSYGLASALFAVASDGNSVASLGPITGGPVTALIADASALYVGGQFTNVSATTVGGFIKLSLATGQPTTDAINSGSGFSPLYTGPALTELVSSLALSGNTLYVGGAFLRHNGAQVGRGITAIDATSGSPLPGFAPGSGCERADVTAAATSPRGAVPTVAALAIAGNDVLIGGGLGAYRGISVANLAKFQTDSNTFDGNFRNNARPDGEVDALLFWDGNLFVGGQFAKIVPFSPGVTVSTGPFAALDPKDGSLLTTSDGFTAPVLHQGSATTFSVNALQGSGSTIFIGGSFDQGASKDKYLMTINANTGVNAAATTFAEFDGPVTAISRVLQTSAVDVAGTFTTYEACTPTCPGSQTVTGYVRLNPNESVVAGYALGLQPASGSVRVAYDVALNSDYASLATDFIFVGGSFQALQVPSPPPSYTRAGLAQFNVANFAVPASALPYAPNDPSFVGGGVRAFFSQPTNIDAPIAYVGGDFAFVDGLARPGLARLILPPPGTAATAFFLDQSYDAGLDGPVYQLNIFGGLLWATGAFHSYQGTAVANVVSFDPATGQLSD